MLVLLVIVIGGFFTALLIDYAVHSDGSVRNVSVDGTAVGGLKEEEVRERIQTIADEFADRRVHLLLPRESIVATAEELGFRLDVDAGVAEVLRAGRGSLASIPFRWLGAFFTPYEVHLNTLWSEEAAEAYIAGFPTIEISRPTSAQIVFEDDPEAPGRSFQIAGGSAGEQIAPESLRSALRRAGERAALPESLTLEKLSVSPEIPTLSLQAGVDHANEVTKDGLTIYLGDTVRDVLADELRSWITPVPGKPGEAPSVHLDTERVGELLQARLASIRIEGDPGQIELIDGAPTVVGTTPSFKCCAGDIGEKVFETLRNGENNLQLTFIEDPDARRDLIEETGIRELVGEFTTYFTPGQSRVINIRRIGEIVQGAIIAPGETWSTNEFVGPRTIAKGFAPGGVIYRGLYRQDIGGGVSQFATTLFNAAFFAGLDFGEYQAHTLYIKRYPYGREATISYPYPDLELINNTPYSMMLWPTSTEDSITVSIYSTKYVDIEQSAQEVIEQEECQKVVTTRTRTFLDGSTRDDTVGALYRPGEGLNCDGEPEVPPPDCPQGTAAVDTNFDGWNDSCIPICSEASNAQENCRPICQGGEGVAGPGDDQGCIPVCGPGDANSPPGTCVPPDGGTTQTETPPTGEGGEAGGAGEGSEAGETSETSETSEGGEAGETSEAGEAGEGGANGEASEASEGVQTQPAEETASPRSLPSGAAPSPQSTA